MPGPPRGPQIPGTPCDFAVSTPPSALKRAWSILDLVCADFGRRRVRGLGLGGDDVEPAVLLCVLPTSAEAADVAAGYRLSEFFHGSLTSPTSTLAVEPEHRTSHQLESTAVITATSLHCINAPCQCIRCIARTGSRICPCAWPCLRLSRRPRRRRRSHQRRRASTSAPARTGMQGCIGRG